MLGMYGEKSIIDESIRRMQLYLQCNDEIQKCAILSPDIRESVYNMIVIHGSLFGYEIIKSLYFQTTLREEQSRILRSLGCATDTNLLQQTLDWCLSEQVNILEILDT
jgi:hypothetical protein